MTLKESGNCALQAGNIALAARRYDTALQYCAVAFMTFPEGNLHFLRGQHAQILQNDGHAVSWTYLLKLMITTRLNLSMTLLRLESVKTSAAIDQAQLALDELRPFVACRGKVLEGRKLDKERVCASHEIYDEAKRLQSKAYFRLGSAQHAAGDYGAAVRSFEHSVKCGADADPKGESKADPLVLRRLAEAKRDNLKKKQRQRKKFKFMFMDEKNGAAGKDDEDEMKE